MEAVAYDAKGNEIGRIGFVPPDKHTMDTLAASDHLEATAHRIVTTDGRVLKDRSGPVSPR